MPGNLILRNLFLSCCSDCLRFDSSKFQVLNVGQIKKMTLRCAKKNDRMLREECAMKRMVKKKGGSKKHKGKRRKERREENN